MLRISFETLERFENFTSEQLGDVDLAGREIRNYTKLAPPCRIKRAYLRLSPKSSRPSAS